MLTNIVNSGVRKTPRFSNVTTNNVVFPDVASQNGFGVGEGSLRGRGVLWAERAPGNCVIFTDRDGVEHDLCGADGTVEVKDEGVSIGHFTSLDFIGPAVVAADAGLGVASITIRDPNLTEVLTSGDDAGGLNITNLGELTFDTAGPKGIQIGTDVTSASTNDATQIAIGQGATADGVGGIILGASDITATGANYNNLVIGNGSVVSGVGTNGAIAIGSTVTASAANAIAIGTDAVASGADAISLGNNATGAGIAIGRLAASTNIYSVAIGFSTYANLSSVAIGQFALATGTTSVAVGQSSYTGGSNCVAVGPSARASYAGAVALGSGPDAYGTNSIAIGSSANAVGNHSIAIGTDSVAITDRAISIGQLVEDKAITTATGVLYQTSLPGVRIIRDVYQTGDLVATDTVVYPLNTGEHVLVDCRVVLDPGAGDDSAKSKAWAFRDFFVQNQAGTAVLTAGTTTVIDPDVFINADVASLVVSGANLIVKVQGATQAVARSWRIMLTVYVTDLS